MRQKQEPNQKKTRCRFAVGLLSLSVAVSTVFALISPAITMEGEIPSDAVEIAESEKPSFPAVTEKGPVEGQAEPSELEPPEPAAEEVLSEEEPEADAAPAAVFKAATTDRSWPTNSVTISSHVTLENAVLQAGEFTFELLDAETDRILQTAANDAEGNIEFAPISYTSGESGIYRYKIREKAGTEPNVTYDSNVYTVSVGVEKGASAPQTLSDKYYGIKSSNPYGWNMSTTPGGRDYFVYCIDATKPSPGSTAVDSPYWIAELEPDNEMLRAAVCHTSTTTPTGVYVPSYDGWLDTPSLKENLKKILYTVTYGSLSYLDGTQKAQLVWWATSGSYYLYTNSRYDQYYDYMAACLNSALPSGYDLVLFHASDGESQPFVTLLESSSTAAFLSDEVAFTNTYRSPKTENIGTCNTPSASVTLTARKTLDGKVPGADRIFTFRLLDENGNILQTVQNDADGTVTFAPLTYTEAGTYRYSMQEINDGQDKVIYDTAPRPVTVTVTAAFSGAATNFDFSADSYYGLASDDSDDSKTYYLSKTMGGTDLSAYCIDAMKDFPPLSYDLTSGYDRTRYSVIQDPGNDTLESYVGQVKASGKTAENLRKLLYYIDRHPELSQQKKNALVWTATSKADSFYTSVSQSELDAIYASTTAPSNFHLALFYPSQSGGKRASYVSLEAYQPLLAGYYASESVLSAECPEQETFVFKNKMTYELPATGGTGTALFTAVGLVCMAGAAVIGRLSHRQRAKGYRKKEINVNTSRFPAYSTTQKHFLRRNHMKKLKLITSALLVLALVLSLGIPALAANTGSITIKNPIAKQSYYIYRIFDLESYDKTNNSYSYILNSDWEDFAKLDTIRGTYITWENGVGKIYVKWVEGADATAFARLAIEYAKAHPLDIPITDGGTPTTTADIVFTGLPLGYYLIDSSVGALCALTTTDPNAVVTEKNELTTVVKFVKENSTNDYVSENSAKVGDTVSFKSEITLGEGAENLVLHDIMNAYLELQTDSIKIYVNQTPVDAANYTVSTEELNTESLLHPVFEGNRPPCTFEISFLNSYISRLSKGAVIRVEYDTVLTWCVKEWKTFQNKAWVSFGDDLTSTESTTTTHTYSFDLIKTDDKGFAIQTAKFYLYDSQQGGNVIPLVPLGEDTDTGVYRYRVATGRDNITGNGAEIKAGYAYVYGLDKQVYFLEETEQPVGFNKLSERVRVDMTDGDITANTGEGFYQKGGVVIGSDVSGKGGVQVINKTGTVLPSTGGMGTTLLYTLGGILVAAAGVLLITKKRMNHEGR